MTACTTTLDIEALAETLYYMAGVTANHADAIAGLGLTAEAEQALRTALRRCA